MIDPKLATRRLEPAEPLGPLGHRGQGYAINPLVEQLATSACRRGLQRCSDCRSAQAPQESAQRVADLGVRAILNFAPLLLRSAVLVCNIDLAGEPAILTHRLSLE